MEFVYNRMFSIDLKIGYVSFAFVFILKCRFVKSLDKDLPINVHTDMHTTRDLWMAFLRFADEIQFSVNKCSR